MKHGDRPRDTALGMQVELLKKFVFLRHHAAEHGSPQLDLKE
jgi:hypothetical protein